MLQWIGRFDIIFFETWCISKKNNNYASSAIFQCTTHITEQRTICDVRIIIRLKFLTPSLDECANFGNFPVMQRSSNVISR